MKKSLFQESGRLGGRKRARNLSPERRAAIASQASRCRWMKKLASPALMESVRFNEPRLDDPAYLEEVLLDGTLNDWRQISSEIVDRPFGAVAKAIEIVLDSTSYYGITPLWKRMLKSAQGHFS